MSVQNIFILFRPGIPSGIRLLDQFSENEGNPTKVQTCEKPWRLLAIKMFSQFIYFKVSSMFLIKIWWQESRKLRAWKSTYGFLWIL